MSTRPGDGSHGAPAPAQTLRRRPVAARYQTSWGEGAVTVCEGRLIGVCVPGDHALPNGEEPSTEVLAEDRAALRRWSGQLEAYFRGERLGWTLDEVDLHGLGVPDFAARVYEALLAIPAAETISYGGLAELAGYPRAARAVGNAMASNPLPIVVPCHRVIKSDGSYGNYGSDPAYKVLLLEHEREHVARRAARR